MNTTTTTPTRRPHTQEEFLLTACEVLRPMVAMGSPFEEEWLADPPVAFRKNGNLTPEGIRLIPAIIEAAYHAEDELEHYRRDLKAGDEEIEDQLMEIVPTLYVVTCAWKGLQLQAEGKLDDPEGWPAADAEAIHGLTVKMYRTALGALELLEGEEDGEEEEGERE